MDRVFCAFILLLGFSLDHHLCSYNFEIRSTDLIVGTDFIDLYLPSYSILVIGSRPAIKYFGSEHTSNLRSSVVKQITYPGTPRGISSSNWVKFKDSEGRYYAALSYKTVSYCNQSKMKDSVLYDFIPIENLRLQFGGEKTKTESFSMSRTIIAKRMFIHSLTSNSLEAYVIEKIFSNFTILPGIYSDVRVIPFVQHCRSFQMHPRLRSGKYLFTGSILLHHWHEQQFLAVLDHNFDIIFSKILSDKYSSQYAPSRSQKNWMPFWSGCKLYFSKLFAPEHVVSEYDEWTSNDVIIRLPDTTRTPSPAIVPNEYTIRGNAPVITHPYLEEIFQIGCVHIRSSKKIYRHAFYILEMKYPFPIVAFSPLFAFKPYRDIEFVMSLAVRGRDGSMELTYGSMDCESRIAIISLQKLRTIFPEYFIS